MENLELAEAERILGELDADIRNKVLNECVSDAVLQAATRAPLDVLEVFKREAACVAEVEQRKSALAEATATAQGLLDDFVSESAALKADEKREREAIDRGLKLIPCPDEASDPNLHEHFVASIVYGEMKPTAVLVEKMPPAFVFRFRLSDEDIRNFPRAKKVEARRKVDVREKCLKAAAASRAARDAILRLDESWIRLAECRRGIGTALAEAHKNVDALAEMTNRQRAAVVAASAQQARRDREKAERIKRLRAEADKLERECGKQG